MRTVDENTITDVFLKTIGSSTDPRFRFIIERLVHHLHQFAKETELTHAEWKRGIEFLEATGHISDADRHEFILLSDVLGLSSLVDMLHSPLRGTSSSVLGPFHAVGAPALDVGGDLRGDAEGDVVLVTGRVVGPEEEPVGGAVMDIWQTASNGLYSIQDPEQSRYAFQAVMNLGDDGRYAFTTVRPAPYTVPTDGPVGDILRATGRHPWRPSHLHFIVRADGYRPLVTEVFPDDDPYLDEDAVFGVRNDLVMRYEPQPAGTFPEGLAISSTVEGPWSKVDFNFVLERAEA